MHIEEISVYNSQVPHDVLLYEYRLCNLCVDRYGGLRYIVIGVPKVIYDEHVACIYC